MQEFLKATFGSKTYSEIILGPINYITEIQLLPIQELSDNFKICF